MAYPSTFLDIQNQVIAKLRLDSSADLQRVKDYINRAYAETCIETEALQTYASMACTANSYVYTLPSAAVRIKQLTFTGNGAGIDDVMIPTSIEQILEWRSNGGDNAGQPTHYAVNGLTEIAIYPTPTSSNDTINVWYVKQPTALSGNTDTPALPEPYGTRCLENGACYEAAIFAMSPMAQTFKVEYETAKAQLRSHLRRMQGAMTRQFRVTKGDFRFPHDPSVDIRTW